MDAHLCLQSVQEICSGGRVMNLGSGRLDGVGEAVVLVHANVGFHAIRGRLPLYDSQYHFNSSNKY